MLLRLVVKELELRPREPRSFIVSVSGGADSMVLASVLLKLSKKYPVKLKLLHVNYGLRGEDSKKDQKVVERFAKKHCLSLVLHRVQKKIVSSIQEAARNTRLELSQKFSKEFEWVEAHHADDQVETFLFRLLRGTGVSGLAAIQRRSTRKDRVIWRPFLSVQKKDLLAYAKGHRVNFRDDKSNFEIKYDRNWLRNRLLPEIETRFPAAKDSILRIIAQIQEEQVLFQTLLGSVGEAATVGQSNPSHAPDLRGTEQNDPMGTEQGGRRKKSPKEGVRGTEQIQWNWSALRQTEPSLLYRFIHSSFYSQFAASLTRDHVIDLASKIRSRAAFTFNAPRGIVVRGRLK